MHYSVLKLLMIFEQEPPHFNFTLGPTNHVDSLGCKSGEKHGRMGLQEGIFWNVEKKYEHVGQLSFLKLRF